MRGSAPPIFSVPARYALFAEFAKGVRSLQPTLHKNCAFATLQTRLAAPLWNCKFAVARHLGFTLCTAVQICAIFTTASLENAFLFRIPLLNMGRERKLHLIFFLHEISNKFMNNLIQIIYFIAWFLHILILKIDCSFACFIQLFLCCWLLFRLTTTIRHFHNFTSFANSLTKWPYSYNKMFNFLQNLMIGFFFSILELEGT